MVVHIAEQTANNACASVALLNIVNNIEGIELGENLQHFKDFTMPFTPALRGDAINNFEFVKRVHNSFARYVKRDWTLARCTKIDRSSGVGKWTSSIQTSS